MCCLYNNQQYWVMSCILIIFSSYYWFVTLHNWHNGKYRCSPGVIDYSIIPSGLFQWLSYKKLKIVWQWLDLYFIDESLRLLNQIDIFFANFPQNLHIWVFRALYAYVDIKFLLKTTINSLKIAFSNQKYLLDTIIFMLDTTVSTKLVPLGTNWKQEFCYRGPPRTKWHSVSECRNPLPGPTAK